MKLTNSVLEQTKDTKSVNTQDTPNVDKKLLNVLFIGDDDTASPDSYASVILQTGLVTGDIVSTQGDITKLFSLLQSSLNESYDVVSFMFSNSTPDLKADTIDLLNVMFSRIKNLDLKLITISSPTKEFAPYGHVKYANTEKIAEWMGTESYADYNINAYKLTDNPEFFEKNKILLNKVGHLAIAKKWLGYLVKLQPKSINAIKKKIADTGLDDSLNNKTFTTGDKSPKIMKLQRRLRSLEYKIDANEAKVGEFGKSTYTAVRMFQLINELPVNGKLDTVTVNNILSSEAKSFSKWGSLFATAPEFIKKLGLGTANTPATTALATTAATAVSSMPAGPSNSDEPTGKNGKLSNSELKSIGNGQKLSPKAADAFLEMEKAANEDGVTFDVSDSYRTFEIQNTIFDWERYRESGERKKRGTNKAAALPGTSNHGWGNAIDVFPKKAQDWIKQNGEKYGWSWAEGRSVGENWHFTYVG
jgi:peptidoglycan hydrolase-like protein with peptidoglycan-binding domain